MDIAPSGEPQLPLFKFTGCLLLLNYDSIHVS